MAWEELAAVGSGHFVNCEGGGAGGEGGSESVAPALILGNINVCMWLLVLANLMPVKRLK